MKYRIISIKYGAESSSCLDLLCKGNFGSDAVEILHSFLGDDSGVDLKFVSLAALLDDLELLELLEAPTDNLAAAGLVVRSAGSNLVVATVNVSQEFDSGSGPDIDLAGQGGDSGVEPVVIKRGEFLHYIKLNLLLPVLT